MKTGENGSLCDGRELDFALGQVQKARELLDSGILATEEEKACCLLTTLYLVATIESPSSEVVEGDTRQLCQRGLTDEWRQRLLNLLYDAARKHDIVHEVVRAHKRGHSIVHLSCRCSCFGI